MKINIIRSKFLEGLKKVQNVAGSKGAVSIIQNVLIEAADNKLSMTTTDLDLSVKSTVSCEVLEGGATTLPVRLLSGTVSTMAEGPIEIEVDEKDSALVRAGSAVFKITGISKDEFPELPSGSGTFVYTLPQAVLREMLRKTSYAVDVGDTNRPVRGLLMSFKDGKVTIVGTDGKRMALVEHEIEFPDDAERDIIIPLKVVGELQRSLNSDGDVSVTLENTQVAFNLGDTQIYSKLIEGVYPDYRRVIPNQECEKICVDRKLLADALNRVRVLQIVDSDVATSLTFDNNQLIVSSNSNLSSLGEMRDVVPVKYSGEKIQFLGNPDYLSEALNAIDDDEVIIDITNGSRPLVVKCSIKFLYIMMPVRR